MNSQQAIKLTLPESNPVPRISMQNLWLTIVSLAAALMLLDARFLNVSIPAMMSDLSANIEDIQWIVTSNLIGCVLMIPITSWLKDRWGFKQVLTYSLGFYASTSLLCALSQNLTFLIFFRTLQAFAGGPLIPLGIAMIVESFAKNEQAKAFGLWTMGMLSGSVLGPILGGILQKYFGWPSIFFIQVPIALLLCWFGWAFLSENPTQKNVLAKPFLLNRNHSFDKAGFISFGLFLISFFWGLSKGDKLGWNSPWVILSLLLSAFSLIWFLLIEWHSRSPLIDLRLFKKPIFSLTIVFIAVRAFVLYGSSFILPVFLQKIKGLDPIQTGFNLMPAALMLALISPITSKFLNRWSSRHLIFIGSSLLMLFFYQYRNLSAFASLHQIVIPMALQAIGLALVVVPMSTVALNEVPVESTGKASALLSLVPDLAGAIGIAVMSIILSHRKIYQLSLMGAASIDQSDLKSNEYQVIYNRARDLGLRMDESAEMARATLHSFTKNEALVMSFRDTYLVAAAIMSICVLGAFLLPKKEKSSPKNLTLKSLFIGVLILSMSPASDALELTPATFYFVMNKKEIRDPSLSISSEFIKEESPSKTVWSIEDVLAMAIENDVELKSVLIDNKTANLKLSQLKSKMYPKFNFELGHTLDEKPKFGLLNNDNRLLSSGPSNWTLHGEWKIFNGFKTNLAIEAAQYALQSMDARLEQKRLELIKLVRTQFYEVIGDQFLLEVSEQNISTLQEHLRQIQMQSQNGVSAKFDVLRVEVQLQEARLEKNQYEEKLMHSRIQLFQNLGKVDQGEILKGQFDEAWNKIDINKLELHRESHPSRREAMARYNELQAQRKAFANHWLPEVSFYADDTHYENIGNKLNENPSHTTVLGLQLRWTLFNGGSDQTQVLIAQNEEIKTQLLIADYDCKVEMDFNYFKKRLQNHISRINLSVMALKKAEENVRLVQVCLNEGLCTNTNVLDAILDLNRTKGLWIRSQIETIDSLGQLEKIIGRSLI